MRHLAGSYTRPVPDDDSRFPDPAGVAEVELSDPNPAAQRCSAVNMSLAHAVQTWDHGHERERGERKYQLEVLPKVGRPLLIIGVFILAKYPTIYRGGGGTPSLKVPGWD